MMYSMYILNLSTLQMYISKHVVSIVNVHMIYTLTLYLINICAVCMCKKFKISHISPLNTHVQMVFLNRRSIIYCMCVYTYHYGLY